MSTEMDHIRRELDDQLNDTHRSVWGGGNSFSDKIDREYVARQNRDNGTSYSTKNYRDSRKLGMDDPWTRPSSSEKSKSNIDSSSRRSFLSDRSSSSFGSSSFNSSSDDSSSFGSSSDDFWSTPPPQQSSPDNHFHDVGLKPYSNKTTLSLMPAPPNFGGVSRGHAGQHMRIVDPTIENPDNLHRLRKSNKFPEQYQPYIFEKKTEKSELKSKVDETQTPGKLFAERFYKSLTKDMFKNGVPYGPVSIATSLFSALVDAGDTIERSQTEQVIREAMSYIPVIAQLELVQRAAENDYVRTMERINVDIESYMEQGYNKKSAEVLAAFDNDLIGDTNFFAVSAIVDKEMGKNFKPKPKSN
jgi:hypothetical protein